MDDAKLHAYVYKFLKQNPDTKEAAETIYKRKRNVIEVSLLVFLNCLKNFSCVVVVKLFCISVLVLLKFFHIFQFCVTIFIF